MTCKQCVIPTCEKLIWGKRDLCEAHFMKLSKDERTRLDDLQADGREVYASTLQVCVEKLTRPPVQVNAFGYPVGPVVV